VVGALKKLSTTVWLTLLVSIAVFAWALVAQPAIAQDQRDCDNNAIIRCGALTIPELQQKYNQNVGNTQTIFSQFGVSGPNDFNGMVMGSVNTNNEMIFNNKVVATNALTAGRQDMPGSTPIAGGAYMRPPSVSFANRGMLSALIKMENGQFKFAVITSCGNPVKAQPVPPPAPPPPKVPNFTINKEVKLSTGTTWHKDVNAQNDQTVSFRVIIKNTGQTELKNVAFRDVLPEGLSAVSNSLRLNSQTVSNITTPELIRANIGSIAVGQQAVLIFNAAVEDDAEACGSERLINHAFAKPPNLPEKQSQASVEVCKPAPPTPVTPPPAQPVVQAVVTELPKTGAGELITGFLLISSSGALWYKFVLPFVRRFSF
jgi:uncharacterized repeat protein (TIGR01451 family)